MIVSEFYKLLTCKTRGHSRGITIKTIVNIAILKKIGNDKEL